MRARYGILLPHVHQPRLAHTLATYTSIRMQHAFIACTAGGPQGTA
jgi:hypothetical protein